MYNRYVTLVKHSLEMFVEIAAAVHPDRLHNRKDYI